MLPCPALLCLHQQRASDTSRRLGGEWCRRPIGVPGVGGGPGLEMEGPGVGGGRGMGRGRDRDRDRIRCRLGFVIWFLFRVLLSEPGLAGAQQGGGTWEVVVHNAGVSAMHMVVTYLNTVIIFDRTDFGPSNISLPDGRCRYDPNDLALTVDCFAHSVEYTIADNSIRPLEILTDTWCSSGAVKADGTFVQTGGDGDGTRVVRWFVPCSNKTCDWNESPPNVSLLQVPRWYATDQILPDDRLIAVGGRSQFSYEFVPRAQAQELYTFSFLSQTFATSSAAQNLYPFLHLCPDGNLFVFANQDSILFNYTNNTVIKSFPRMPGFESRNYPSSGSSVMLPLSYQDEFQAVEIMVCGGAPQGATAAAQVGRFLLASKNCGRLRITDPEPFWVMEAMPTPRVMADMIMLPSGDVLIINGCQAGSAGWGLGRSPSLAPFLYHPDNQLYFRFETLASTTIPRLYHSSAVLLPDARVLVAGSNPNEKYAFTNVLYPTELRMEAFSPPYLSPTFDSARPNITLVSPTQVSYSSTFRVAFTTMQPLRTFSDVQVVLYAPPLSTHSFSMNQRMLQLSGILQTGGDLGYQLDVLTPPNAMVAPAGFYIMFLLHQKVPSLGTWLQLLPRS